VTKRWAGLLVVVLALVFAFVVCEVGVRLFLPQEVFGVRMERFPPMYQSSESYSFVLLPDVSVTARIVDRQYNISTNKDGYRTTTGAITTDKKVVLLGDSMTFGQGLDDGETMASRLQNATGWIVTNAGVPG